MPDKCVVKNCEASKIKTVKVSTFKVPHDESEREKWRLKIGVPTLLSFHRVCEKHFEKSCVVKEYVKHDNNGRIIAQVPLKRARLKPGSVPTIFEESRTRSNSSCRITVRESIMMEHTYSFPWSYTNSNLENMQNSKCNNSNRECFMELDLTTDSDVVTEEVAAINTQEVATVNTQEVAAVNTDEGTAANTEEGAAVNTKVPCERLMQMNANTTVCETSITDCETKTDTSNEHTESNEIGENMLYRSPTTVKITYDDDNTVSFNFTNDCNDALKDVKLNLPKPWGLQKSYIQREEVLVFTYLVENRDGEKARYIFEKTVIVKKSKEIIYEVFSTVVDISETKLPKTLTNISILPELLKKFKNMRICKGVSSSNVQCLQTSVWKTCIGSDMRHKNCSILSNNAERCRACKIYNTSLLRSLKKAKQAQETFGRISSSKNNMDQIKLNALRKKCKSHARKSQRLKHAYAIYNNIRLKMGQYTYQKNQKFKKQSAVKKKMSKLENT